MSAGPKTLVEKLVGIAIKSLPIKTVFHMLDRKMLDNNSMKNLEDRFKQLVAAHREPLDMRGENICMQEQINTNPVYVGLKPYLKSTLEYYDTTATKNPMQLHNEQTQSTAKDNPLLDKAMIAKVIEIEYRIRTDEQALITTLAILRYNAGSDSYPRELQQLVSTGHIKEVPKDPFSNNPLVYKQTRQGFTLYSFGADYDDDGGQYSKWGAGDEGGDQVFWPVEQTQTAQRQPRRERPMARPESFQRRANISAGAATSPYLINGEDRMMPAARPGSQRQKSTSIHDAARNGDVNHAQQLISKGADVNTRNRINWTPLHTAVINRKQAFVELLISKGADLNAKDNRGQTPLHVAVNTNQKEVVELLIAKGADVNIMAGSNNALTLANRRNNTEIVDILVKNGAKEPSPQDLMGDRYYGGGANPYSRYQEQSTTQPGTIRRGGRTGRTINQAPAAVDILADPNEIKARVKTFAGLEKVLEEVANKSQNEMRQWPQRRYDNRTMLVRAVQKQFEDEIGFIRKVAVEEKARKTTEAIDSVLTTRQERIKNISRELMAQKRQLRQTQQQTSSTRGRGRTSGRSTRGQTSQGGQQYEQYGRNATEQAYGRGNTTTRTGRYPGTTRGPSQQTTQPIDREAENETRQWLQASFDNKSDLASAVHEQIRLEVTSIRDLAVEEAAKKTTATIDGLLLARKMRLDAFIIKMEEQQQALRQQAQDPRARGGYQQDSRYNRGQTTRGGTTGGYQQGSQSRTRRRR